MAECAAAANREMTRRQEGRLDLKTLSSPPISPLRPTMLRGRHYPQHALIWRIGVRADGLQNRKSAVVPDTRHTGPHLHDTHNRNFKRRHR